MFRIKQKSRMHCQNSEKVSFHRLDRPTNAKFFKLGIRKHKTKKKMNLNRTKECTMSQPAKFLISDTYGGLICWKKSRSKATNTRDNMGTNISIEIEHASRQRNTNRRVIALRPNIKSTIQPAHTAPLALASKKI